jgi:predicted nuclease with TOPRIM domain
MYNIIMTEHPRIFVSRDSEAPRLRDRVEALEKEVASLEKMQHRLVEHYSGIVQELASDCTEIYQRLKNLEYSVFPNLAADMIQAHKIVPFTDKLDNGDLDRRTDVTGNPKPKKV